LSSSNCSAPNGSSDDRTPPLPIATRYSPTNATVWAPNTEEPPSTAAVGRNAEKVTNIIPCRWSRTYRLISIVPVNDQ